MDKQKAKELLQKFLVEATGGCIIQNGWPCGRCTTAFLSGLIDTKAEEYKERNDPIDRINEVWRFLLQVRGD